LRSVYADDDIEVFFRPATSDLLIVTFNPANFQASRRAFWGDWLTERLRCGALGIVSKSNNWFPSRSLRAAAAAAAPLIGDFPEILTLGLSMGAYGALKHGRLFGAQLSVVFSPQSPTVRATLPNSLESRTPEAFRGLDVRPVDVSPRSYVFYDPLFVVDRRSMQVMTEAGTALIPIRTYCSGHHNLQLFKKNIESLIGACRSDDRSRLSALWAQARRTNPKRGRNLAILAARRHPAWARELYQLYIADFTPKEATKFLVDLAFSWLRTGNHDGAQSAIQMATPLAVEANHLQRLQRARDILRKRRARGMG
jgi:hypothetical protein